MWRREVRLLDARWRLCYDFPCCDILTSPHMEGRRLKQLYATTAAVCMKLALKTCTHCRWCWSVGWQREAMLKVSWFVVGQRKYGNGKLRDRPHISRKRVYDVLNCVVIVQSKSVHKLFASCIRRCLVSRASDWVISALSAALLIFSFQFSLRFFNILVARLHQHCGVLVVLIRNIGHRTLPKIWVNTILVRNI